MITLMAVALSINARGCDFIDSHDDVDLFA